jgi:hypothetical protein
VGQASWPIRPKKAHDSSQKGQDPTDKQTMQISAIALQGLNQAQSQVDKAFGTLASLGANPDDGTSVDTVDLSTAAVSLISAKNVFSTDIQMLKVADEMQGQALQLLA